MNNNLKLTQSVHSRQGLLTRQRQLVLRVLKETPGHLDASMVYQEAKKRDNRISLATVYRSLDFLKNKGLVEENSLGEDHAHFEAIQGDQHYHFTCLSCGKVIEFSAIEMPAMIERLWEQNGLAVTEINLYLRGYCPDCQKKTNRSKS